MPAAARDWLPSSAVEGDLALRKIDRVVAQWSKRWFPAEVLRPASLAFFPSGRASDGDGEWLGRGGIAVKLSTAGRLRLVYEALDMDGDGVSLTDTDRQLVDGFSTRMLEDLLHAFEADLTTDDLLFDHSERAPAVVAWIADGMGDVLTISIASDIFIASLRASLGRNRSVRPMLTSFDKALGENTIDVVVGLGGVRLSVAELQGLGPGDVLVLDAPLSAGVTLSMSNFGNGFAAGRLGRADGQAVVTVLDPSLLEQNAVDITT